MFDKQAATDDLEQLAQQTTGTFEQTSVDCDAAGLCLACTAHSPAEHGNNANS
jgi:hypothetical protein